MVNATRIAHCGPKRRAGWLSQLMGWPGVDDVQAVFRTTYLPRWTISDGSDAVYPSACRRGAKEARRTNGRRRVWFALSEVSEVSLKSRGMIGGGVGAPQWIV